ncbi:LysR substrate-binding domain-containing protein [Thioalkalivibrio paradoxus]|uniref:LysR family transcriptional regulator n=1 Tax=Thioalkalivibrio paradoxus ARh 1 TaxID=713585 RepID=W0DRE9_9GAMM|nr:LysR substrate-binding domain-containing protein [Thioalkalivibrio paradoxus]AHE99435.1 LysR family transcriptional regulator [Thioalkalivibrio paradoxus ARh 1]
MELRQLRSLVTLADSGFSVSRAAQQLHLVQPAVSQHLRLLEAALGTPLFLRHGKRLVGLTEAGQQVLRHARSVLAEVGNIVAVGRDHVEEARGVLRIGTTHTQARYVLPPVLIAFKRAYPEVEVQIHQGTPAQLVEMALADRVDLAVCTEAVGEHDALITLPSYRWNRCLITTPGHPLLQRRPISLGALCEYPMITYVFGFTGRTSLSQTFAKVGLHPRVVLSAADADVIKTYVRSGMGIGIIADLAFHTEHDRDLERRDLSHLFPWEVTRVAYPRGKYVRRFQQRFIDLFQQQADRIGRGWGAGRLGAVVAEP